MSEAHAPHWQLDDALRRARTANRLAAAHRAVLEPRLAAGLLDQLASDRALLGDASARGTSALTNRKTATRHEREIAAHGHDLVVLIRGTVKTTADAPEALRTAMSVGETLDARNTQAVLSALRAVIDHAVPLAACGVTSSDIALAQQLADELLAADGMQSDRSETRKATTEDRRDAHLRLEKAVRAISARGALAFMSDTVERSRFERLVATAGPTAEDESAAGAEPTGLAQPPKPA